MSSSSECNSEVEASSSGSEETSSSGSESSEEEVPVKKRAGNGASVSERDEGGGMERMNAALVLTADHGHVTVQPEKMIELPEDVLECLEYANIGVHGKGRHAYLHCRSGLQPALRQRWRSHGSLTDNFLLLTIDEAIESGLFGPEAPHLTVRPRLGDFVAISLQAHTLVSPAEAYRYRHSDRPICQGAHGSLLPSEMSIPFVLCKP